MRWKTQQVDSLHFHFLQRGKETVSVSNTQRVCVLRCAELEKEVAVLKEKIHHLDDMLKCQQRKVRQMIEQVFMHKSRLHTYKHTHKCKQCLWQDAINEEIRFCGGRCIKRY